jgi:tRNA acetyltransferase TAN1
MNSNLLITYEPNREGMAQKEIEGALKEVGEEKPEINKTEVDGVFEVAVRNDPKKLVAKLCELCKKEPGKFQYTFHWIPIENWSSSDLNDMLEVMKEMERRIGEEEKWKMELNKRLYDKYSSMDLIIKLTDLIDRKNVDLRNPEKVIKVEILGNRAGISLLKPEEMLNVPKMRQSD